MTPNLLYIFADQWRYQAVGCHGGDGVFTPSINRFADESMCFTHAYSTFPLCSPHRASLMTGKYPLQVGMWTNCKIGLEEKIMLKPQETCIGNVLKEAGYATGYIGKWHLDASEQNFTSHPKSGAKNWDAYTPPGERRQGFDYWLSYGADDDHLNPHYWADSETQIRPAKWSAEYETDMALEYIRDHQKKEQPFALFLSYNPPHLPYELVPQTYYERFQDTEITWRENVPGEMRTPEMEVIARQYFAAVYGIDEQFGRIMDYIREQGLEQDTLVVLSSDHGEMLGSHGLMSKNIWYEESIHIPLMMRQKGRICSGENPTIVASPDHMPTLLELLSIPVPDTCEGYGHGTSMLTGVDSGAPKELFLCSYPGSVESVTAYARRGLSHKAFGWRGIKTHRYTYVVSGGYMPEEDPVEYLYDDENDPWQLKPLEISLDTDCPRILGFRRKLEEYLNKIKDPFLLPWGSVRLEERKQCDGI